MASQALPPCTNVVCDELHDLTETTLRLLQIIVETNNAFFYDAGDKDQVIYSELGADQEIWEHRLWQAFPRLARYRLTNSFRYGPRLAKAVAQHARKQNYSSCGAPKTAVLVERYAAPQDCPTLVPARINRLLATGITSVAVVLRHAGQSPHIEAALLNANIHYALEGLEPFYQRPEILMLRALVAGAMQNLSSIKSMHVRELAFEALRAFAEIPADWTVDDRKLALNSAAALDWWLDALPNRSPRNGACIRQPIIWSNFTLLLSASIRYCPGTHSSGYVPEYNVSYAGRLPELPLPTHAIPP